MLAIAKTGISSWNMIIIKDAGKILNYQGITFRTHLISLEYEVKISGGEFMVGLVGGAERPLEAAEFSKIWENFLKKLQTCIILAYFP